MATGELVVRQAERPEDAWESWVRMHGQVLERATAAQRVLLEAVVRFVVAVEGQPVLLRAAAFFLLHAGMGLTPAQVGAAIGRTDRALRTVQALSAREFLESVWADLGRHRQPKLHAEHAGPIAKYLVDHPHGRQAAVVAFIARELGIEVDTVTLRRFLKAYGLNVLRGDRHDTDDADEQRPFPSGALASGAPSSCCPAHSR
jgi:transposase